MGPPLAHASLAGRAPTAASSTALGMESHRAAFAYVMKDSLAPTVPVLPAWIIAVSTVSAWMASASVMLVMLVMHVKRP